jgi:hypothetical protein
LVVLLSLPGTAIVFALLGDRLNLVLSVLAGVVGATATATAHIPHLSPPLRGVVVLFAFVASCEVAIIVSIGLASLAAPALGRGNWITGDPYAPESDLWN